LTIWCKNLVEILETMRKKQAEVPSKVLNTPSKGISGMWVWAAISQKQYFTPLQLLLNNRLEIITCFFG